MQNQFRNQAQIVREQQSASLKSAGFSNLKRHAGGRNASSLNSGNGSVRVSPNNRSSSLLTSEDGVLALFVTYTLHKKYFKKEIL